MTSCPCNQCQGIGPRASEEPDFPEDTECKYCGVPVVNNDDRILVDIELIPADSEGPAYWSAWHLSCREAALERKPL